MESFIYYTPTKVYFGIDSESHIGEFISTKGYSKTLLIYGSNRIKDNGLFSTITDELDSRNLNWCEFGGIQPNPTIEYAREIVEYAKSEDVDFILGIGGGSVSDTAKVVALSLATNKDPWDALLDNAEPQIAFPIGMVLTISAAGSEMSNSCVMTNAALNLKRSDKLDANRPVVAFMNPMNTISVPPFQTAAGSVDILMHTMERYLTAENPTPLTDSIAVSIVKSVIDNTDILMDEPDNIEARSEIMWASSLSHNGLTGCGRNMTFSAHKIEHDFSGYDDSITHGAGLAVLFPAWVEHEYDQGVDRFYSWATQMWGVAENEDKEAAILEGIENCRAKFSSWGMPSTLEDLGISSNTYDTIANLTTDNGNKAIPSFGRQIGKTEILEIYSLASR